MYCNQTKIDFESVKGRRYLYIFRTGTMWGWRLFSINGLILAASPHNGYKHRSYALRQANNALGLNLSIPS